MLSDLTAIPRIMRSMGWANGARLLDSWFSRSSAVAPAYAMPDTATIRMDAWALSFARAREVYDRLIRERIWANPPAKVVIGRMLRRKGLLSGSSGSFGSLSDPVPLQDADYVNERSAGGYTSFDDLTGALGEFTFRVVVAGNVAPISPAPGQPAGPLGYLVTLTEIGAYIRDSFDFEGNQVLGCWSDGPPMQFSPLMPPMVGYGYVPANMMLTPVGNRDFREWRQRSGRGGDFLVFSDMKRVSLTTPDQFVIT
jgi:hypothetical protein